jgi:hypothetical protein
MEKTCYQEIVDEISKKLADKILSEEKNLVRRATSIDGDIADIFGRVQIRSPYLWLQGVSCSKPLLDDMRIYHNSRSEAVIRALSDFGIEESFANAAIRFKEHYHYDIGQVLLLDQQKRRHNRQWNL